MTEEPTTSTWDAMISAMGAQRGTSAADSLCEACVGLVGVDAAAISLIFDGANTGILGASGPEGRVYDELQFVYGEGPCLDSVAVRAPVFTRDLADGSEKSRWPGYGSALLEKGIHAVFAVPVLVAGQCLGALSLFRADAGALIGSALRAALVAAECAELPVLDLLARGVNEADSDPDAAAWSELKTVARAEVSQATGSLVAQLNISPAHALARLRAHAYRTGRDASAVARDILEQRLQLEA